MTIVWTERALADLEAIGDYIAADNPLAADRWVREILSAVERAATLPLAGRSVPEVGRPDIREVLRDARIGLFIGWPKTAWRS